MARPSGAGVVLCVIGTHTACLLRPSALDRVKELEGLHEESIAFEMLGPPRLSKLLFEGHLLKTPYKSLEEILSADPTSIESELVSVIGQNPRLRAKILSVGIPILLPDGESFLRGKEISTPEFKGKNSIEIEPGQTDHWAREGWVDLRSANWRWWHEQLSLLRDEVAAGQVVAGQRRATIEGQIVDSSQNPIPNVQVTAINLRTGLMFTCRTNRAGRYKVDSPPPGEYMVSAAHGLAVTCFSCLLFGGVVVGVALCMYSWGSQDLSNIERNSCSGRPASGTRLGSPTACGVNDVRIINPLIFPTESRSNRNSFGARIALAWKLWPAEPREPRPGPLTRFFSIQCGVGSRTTGTDAKRVSKLYDIEQGDVRLARVLGADMQHGSLQERCRLGLKAWQNWG